MKQFNTNPPTLRIQAQSGMTLIELTVVLLVLIGLAGLLIPYATGFIDKTHDATGAGTMSEATSAIARFEIEKQRYPNGMDSMIVGAGNGGSGTLIDYFIADKMGMSASMAYGFTPIDLSQAANDEVCGALSKAGITKAVDMKAATATPFNATFDNAASIVQIAPEMLSGATPCATAGWVVEVSAGKVASALGIDTTNKRYVAFGIGGRSELTGQTMTDAPVHFAKKGEYNAANAYNRFVAIFQVDADTAKDLTAQEAMRAKFVGTAMLMGGITGKEADLKSFYSAVTN